MAASAERKVERPTGGGVSPDRQRERVLLWAVLFLGVRALLPMAGFLPRAVALPVALVLYMLVALWGPRVAAQLAVAPRRRIPLFILFALLSYGIAWSQPGALSRESALLLGAFSDLFLIGAAAMLGQVLAGLFREPNLLVPAAVAAAVVDYWGVNYGTTHAVLEKAGGVVSKLSVQVPVPVAGGMPDLQLGIGFGDFVFLTLFLVCATKFGLREGVTFWLSFVILLAAMGIVIALNLNVPALVPMAVAFLIANTGRFRFQRSEVFAMGYAALLIALLVGLALLLHGSLRL